MRSSITTTGSIRLLPLAAVGALAVYGIVSAVGAVGIVLVFAILLLGALLVLRARADDTGRSKEIAARIAVAALICVPAALTLFFSFNSGGFFPDSVAFGAMAVAIALVARLSLAEQPLAAFGPQTLVPAAGLAGLAAWALLSQFWSDAPGRALIGFQRDLLYLLVFLLFASIGRSYLRLSWLLRVVALSMVAVAAVALLTRVAPDILAVAESSQARGRLAYPLTYWNALGILCAIAAILCMHLAAADGSRVVRVLASAALPVIGTTLLLTYSRGAMAAAVIGLGLYIVSGRPRGLLSALIATLPSTAIAMKVAYDSTALSAEDVNTSAALDQGHHLATVVIGCVILAIALRSVLLLLDRLLEGEESPIDRYRRLISGFAAATAIVAVIAAVGLGAPGQIADRWDQFVNQRAATTGLEVRDRLASSSNQGRLEAWSAATDGFDRKPLTGTGAETYDILWYQERASPSVIVDGHSLYIETLGELGLFGLALVLLTMVGLLLGLAPFGRGRDRALYAVIFSAAIAWMLHAGVDWDWEMPAVTLWLLALGGLALARPQTQVAAPRFAHSGLAAAIGVVVIAACVAPGLVAASQTRLNDATEAFASGDCAQATRFAEDSIDVLGTRSPPWQVKALCEIRARDYRHAQASLQAGLAKDPDNWQLHGALAAVKAAKGQDARAEAATALHLNPGDPDVRALAFALRGKRGPKTRRAARVFLSKQALTVPG
ncbi:MAG TPA: O-antigen ligase family protein [Baekduia sp.]|nr:O-antigen ligase family protein [Baekduia sp.]